jgi:pimeloyl-ACP methyl ester carboxylesterase
MTVVPYRIDIRDEALTDLRERLRRTRWPDEVAGSGWDYGVPRAWLRDLCDHWSESFDWRAIEARLNEWPQFRAEIAGAPIHFLHLRGQGPKPLPLLITVGWPSTFAEVLPVLRPLCDPASFGGDAADAFDVVVPTIPGFGFSAPYDRGGPLHIEDLWADLMSELGYPRFGSAGSDWGAYVTSRLGRFHPDRLVGLQFFTTDLQTPEPPAAELTSEERDYLARLRDWERFEGGYAAIQQTKPQTLAYGLTDSPAGLAAWIAEKFHAWADGNSSFTRDDLLTTATIYWVTDTINSSIRLYYEDRHDPRSGPLAPDERIHVPTGVVTFPHGAEPNMPRSLVERAYPVQRWTDLPGGGHFPGIETPDAMVNELREFFRPLR